MISVAYCKVGEVWDIIRRITDQPQHVILSQALA
jgi:hypothetical protein